MYSCLVTARIKGEDEYSFFRYQGKPMDIPFRGIKRPLEKGQVIGVRKSSNGKQIRMVFQNDLTRVMTLDLPLAQKIARFVKAV